MLTHARAATLFVLAMSAPACGGSAPPTSPSPVVVANATLGPPAGSCTPPPGSATHEVRLPGGQSLKVWLADLHPGRGSAITLGQFVTWSIGHDAPPGQWAYVFGSLSSGPGTSEIGFRAGGSVSGPCPRQWMTGGAGILQPFPAPHLRIQVWLGEGPIGSSPTPGETVTRPSDFVADEPLGWAIR